MSFSCIDQILRHPNHLRKMGFKELHIMLWISNNPFPMEKIDLEKRKARTTYYNG